MVHPKKNLWNVILLLLGRKHLGWVLTEVNFHHYVKALYVVVISSCKILLISYNSWGKNGLFVGVWIFWVLNRTLHEQYCTQSDSPSNSMSSTSLSDQTSWCRRYWNCPWWTIHQQLELALPVLKQLISLNYWQLLEFCG